MPETIKWIASDSAIRPRVNLSRDAAPVDLASVSAAAIIFRQIVASGVTPVTASYAATVAASQAVTDGIVETLVYGSAPLATVGQYRQQVRLTTPAGTETFETPFTVVLGARF